MINEAVLVSIAHRLHFESITLLEEEFGSIGTTEGGITLFEVRAYVTLEIKYFKVLCVR